MFNVVKLVLFYGVSAVLMYRRGAHENNRIEIRDESEFTLADSQEGLF